VFEAVSYDEESGPARLFAVPVDGSRPQVELDVPDYTRVDVFLISQDDSRVAFVRGSGSSGELYAAALDGTQLQQLAPGSITALVGITADGSRVVYVQNHLYSVLNDGTQRVQLDPPTGGAGAARLTPDLTRVVFVASGNLYSSPIDVANRTLLLGPGATADFEISADSTIVVAVVAAGNFRALVRLSTTGGATPVLLNGPAVSGRGVAALGQKLALTATRAVYRQERDQDGVLELFSAPLDGSAPEVRISQALGGASDVQTFLLSADGQRAVFLADPVFDEAFELFGTPLDGSLPPRRYHPPFEGGPVLGDVLAFQGGAGEHVVYRADQDVDEDFELYSARKDGRGSTRLISSGSALSTFQLSDAGRVVAFEVGAGPVHLFGAPSDGTRQPIELDRDETSFPAPLLITPDEARVVYRKRGTSLDLFSCPLDGSTAPVRLSPASLPSSEVKGDFRLDPSGERVVYRAGQEVDGKLELFSVPSDGSGPPLRLNPRLATGGSVSDFRIAPDGREVVFRADLAGNGRFEVFGGPITGERPPTRLHHRLGLRVVTNYAVSADGRRVVLRGDLAVAGQNELFSVASSGALPFVRALGGGAREQLVRLTPLASGQDVQPDFALTADRQVLFRAGAGGLSGKQELFRVPIDGSAPPQRLSAALVTGRTVTSFALSSDGAWVVYRADQRANDLFELFKVPLAGGAAVVLDALPVWADVKEFQIAPDAGFVFYRADRSADEFYELFAVPLDGSGPARKLNNRLAPGGDVQSDFTALSGGRALFRADQQADEVFELFLGAYELGPDHARR